MGVVDEMFGDGIEFGHEPCLGLRVGMVPATGKNRAKAAVQREGGGYEALECIGKDTGIKDCVMSLVSDVTQPLAFAIPQRRVEWP